MNAAFQDTAVEPRESGPTWSPKAVHDEDFRGLTSLEPWISFTIGIAALLAAGASPDGPIPLLLSVCPLLVGAWAWLRRRSPTAERIGRGMLMMGLALAVRLEPGGDTAIAMTLFLFWLTLVSGYYALLLPPPAVAATSAACYLTASTVPSGGAIAPLPAVGGAVFFALLVLVRLARRTRRERQTMQNAAPNSKPAIHSRAGFFSRGEKLLEAQRNARLELSLAVFDCCDLLEIRTLYGRTTSRTLMTYILERLALLAGDKGLVACTGPAQFSVALPLGREQAMQAIGRVLGKPVHFDPGCKQTELVVVPTFVVETVSPADCVSDRLTSMCRSLATINREEQLRLHYLQRVRERHSRSPSTPPPHSTPSASKISARDWPEQARETRCTLPTIPVPLPR